MSSPLAKLMLAALLGGLLAGCQIEPFKPFDDHKPVPTGMSSVYMLAGRLGMSVDQSSRSLACLTGPFNRIVVQGSPDSRVFVNGRPVGVAGRVVAVGDVLFVPDSLEPQIRAALRNGGGVAILPPPPPVGPNVPPLPPVVSPKPVHGLVVLDAGHGGKDPGAARNLNGRPGNEIEEKRLNLVVVQMVAESLKARGASVVLTRADDTFVELDERADIANRRQADLFLSIHTNSSVKPQICGFAVYVAESPSPGSVAAAEDIAKHVQQAGVEPCGSQPHRALYRVLVHNRRPAVLMEMGFITNTDDRARLVQAAYQRRLADAVADGIADFLRNH